MHKTTLFCVWCGAQDVHDHGEALHQPTRILLCKTCHWKFELPLEWWGRRREAQTPEPQRYYRCCGHPEGGRHDPDCQLLSW